MCAALRASASVPHGVARARIRDPSIPHKQQARERAGRCAARIECAVHEEPVSRMHVDIMVLAVVLAAGEIGEEVLRVVVVASVGAEDRRAAGVGETGEAPRGRNDERRRSWLQGSKGVHLFGRR